MVLHDMWDHVRWTAVVVPQPLSGTPLKGSGKGRWAVHLVAHFAWKEKWSDVQ